MAGVNTRKGMTPRPRETKEQREHRIEKKRKRVEHHQARAEALLKRLRHRKQA